MSSGILPWPRHAAMSFWQIETGPVAHTQTHRPQTSPLLSFSFFLRSRLSWARNEKELSLHYASSPGLYFFLAAPPSAHGAQIIIQTKKSWLLCGRRDSTVNSPAFVSIESKLLPWKL